MIVMYSGLQYVDHVRWYHNILWQVNIQWAIRCCSTMTVTTLFLWTSTWCFLLVGSSRVTLIEGECVSNISIPQWLLRSWIKKKRTLKELSVSYVHKLNHLALLCLKIGPTNSAVSFLVYLSFFSPVKICIYAHKTICGMAIKQNCHVIDHLANISRKNQKRDKHCSSNILRF